MPKIYDDGKLKIMVTLSKREYDLIRRKAYEMDVTVNQFLRIAALKYRQRK